jgi:hypothetical protein
MLKYVGFHCIILLYNFDQAMDQDLDLQVQMGHLYMEVNTQQCQGPTPSIHYHLQLRVLDFPTTETTQDCTLFPVSVYFPSGECVVNNCFSFLCTLF